MILKLSGGTTFRRCSRVKTGRLLSNVLLCNFFMVIINFDVNNYADNNIACSTGKVIRIGS